MTGEKANDIVIHHSIFHIESIQKQMVLDEEAILKELGEYKDKPGE